MTVARALQVVLLHRAPSFGVCGTINVDLCCYMLEIQRYCIGKVKVGGEGSRGVPQTGY